jgi:hypothetical protein
LLKDDVLCRRKSEVQALAGSLPQLFETFEGITVLDFHRENCGPCKILGEEVTVRVTSPASLSASCVPLHDFVWA